MTLLDDNSFPPRNLETDEEICLYISEHQGIKAHNQGYEWFWTVYMPALERVAKSGTLEPEIIANNFYGAGDVHDFNNAPKTAISLYKRALEFDPKMSTAHREIAVMNRRLGDFEDAIKHSNIALSMTPDSKFAIADREKIDAEKTEEAVSLTASEVAIAEALEALAQRNPKAAIQTLQGFKDKDSLQTLTWAYGADTNISAYLTTWKILVLQSREIEFHHSDWFFIPEELWYESEIWALWKDNNLTFKGVFMIYEGLDDASYETPIDEAFSKLNESDALAQKIEYIFYCQSENLNGLKSIQVKYPNWVELNEKIEMLECEL